VGKRSGGLPQVADPPAQFRIAFELGNELVPLRSLEQVERV
jgi:hypothetical protein